MFQKITKHCANDASHTPICWRQYAHFNMKSLQATEESQVALAVRTHRTLELAGDNFYVITCGRRWIFVDFFLKWKFLSVDGETVRPTRQAPLSWNWWLAGERWHFHFFIICYGSALRTIRSPRAEGLIYSNLNWNASGDWGNLWTRIPTSGHDGHAQREIWAEGKFSHFPDFELVVI